MAIAKDSPNFKDAPKPDPIASPSGKLWSANPMLTIIPVFSRAFFWNFVFVLNFLSTSKSQNIILAIPNNIPKKAAPKLVNPNASGNKSKHTIAIISPDANAKMKLKNL